MPSFSSLVLLALPLVALVDGAPHPRRALQSRAFKLKDHFAGKDFLNWDFFSDADPTHGIVNYVKKEDAIAKGLAFVDSDGFAVLKVDNTTQFTQTQARDSVRISSPAKYTKGLFIADIRKMPHGPTTWPAYWSVGPDWPKNGEIDVLEGVNEGTTNQMTLHTSTGCTLDTSLTSSFTGQPRGSTNCESPGENNSGCGIVDSAPAAYGHEFNVIGGAVFAHLVDDTGIKIWRFPRNKVPADIKAGTPAGTVESWGKPAAFFSTSTCNVDQHFKDHVLVFDTTLCGDLAGNVFPGGKSACEAAVQDPSNFRFAQWTIASIDVYDL